MSLHPSSTTTQHHPLISSRPNSPGEPSSSSLIASIPSSRAVSPGLTPRRRRGGTTSASASESQLPLDDEDDKKQAALRPSPLHRIESFFGVDAASTTPPPTTRRPSAPKGSASSSSSPQTRLVLQHTVSTTDTLQSLALRYKTDVPTLRRVNGLWPGDSVLSRKIMWVPLDKCREMGAREDAKVGTQGIEGGSVIEASPSALGLKNGGSVKSGGAARTLDNSLVDVGGRSATPSASGPSTDFSRSTSPSQRSLSLSQSHSHSRSASRGCDSSPPVVRRLPSEVLGHFPAAPRSDVLAKGKAKAADQWDDEVTSARGKHRLGPGPGMSGFQPGESGLEDLLGEMRGQEPLLAGVAAPTIQQPPEASSSSSPSRPTSPVDEWKPNVWHMGAGGSGKGSEAGEAGTSTKAAESPTKGLRPLKLVDQSIQEWSQRNDRQAATTSSSGNDASYQGWNDVPTLAAYAKGRVAEAYGAASGSSKSKRAGGRAARAHHRFIDDLAAGLPANTGAASKWARPIGDSVPTSSTAAASPQQRPGATSGLLNGKAAGGSGVGFRSLLSDALRGRMGLDEALSKGFEEVLNRTEAWETLPREELEHARQVGAWPTAPPQRQHQSTGGGARISAEEARRSLGRSAGRAVAGQGPLASGDGAGGGSDGISNGGSEGVGPGGVPRRKSQHEMATLPVRPGGGAAMQRRPSRNGDQEGKWGW